LRQPERAARAEMRADRDQRDVQSLTRFTVR
jgi:hypothetical protein